MTVISQFMETHFKHFNARETMDAAKAWRELIESGGKMFLAMAGAMSTAEIGISLAEMIRREKVHAICCTGANLEEDVFNLFSHNNYEMFPGYADLSPLDERDLYERGMNRVTDTCIPKTAMQHVESVIVKFWQEAAEKGEPLFPYQFLYKVLDEPNIEEHFHIPREHSWVLAAKEKGLPIFSPGAADSSLGNAYCAEVMRGAIAGRHGLRTDTELMEFLAKWYMENAGEGTPVGFFQIGGGIAGDFSICVVPMLNQDVKVKKIPLWAYFAQIGDSPTSNGSYSGAPPNEKITWGKLDVNTPRFMINSDATIVAPLIFAYVMKQ